MADNITITTAAVFLPTLWSVETLRATERALVAAGLVKRYDSLVKARGQAIKIPNISNLTVNEKVANSDVTNQVVTETDTTLNITEWWESSFEIEDMVAVQSNYDLRSEYSEKAGYAIAQKVDSDLLALYSTFTTTPQGSYGSDVTDAVIVASILQLNIHDIPLESRAFVIAPSQLAAIMKIDKFVRADYLGEYQTAKPAKTGPNSRYMWGEIYGVPVYYTNQVPTQATTPVSTHNILLHKEAMALALQQAPRLQAAYWLPSLAWKVTVDVIYGLSGLRTTAGVEVKS